MPIEADKSISRSAYRESKKFLLEKCGKEWNNEYNLAPLNDLSKYVSLSQLPPKDVPTHLDSTFYRHEFYHKIFHSRTHHKNPEHFDHTVKNKIIDCYCDAHQQYHNKTNLK
jgi:hypothetical protein